MPISRPTLSPVHSTGVRHQDKRGSNGISVNQSGLRSRRPHPHQVYPEGENLSPPLEWSGAPDGTKSFALVVEDPDAPSGTFRHWGLYNIMPERTALPEGVGHGPKTERLGLGINDFGNAHYDGPAPPKGYGIHHYHFRLLALDVDDLSQGPKARVEDIAQASQEHLIGQAELIGTFQR
jgi:Raf kinase inhibitor-like YbhB/YbcL family protein